MNIKTSFLVSAGLTVILSPHSPIPLPIFDPYPLLSSPVTILWFQIKLATPFTNQQHMNLKVSLPSSPQQEPPLYNMCSLFTNNTIHTSNRKLSQSPHVQKPAERTKKRIKCPPSKLSQPKNIHYQVMQRQTEPRKINIMKNPKNYDHHREGNIASRFQRRQQIQVSITRLEAPPNPAPKQTMRSVIPHFTSPLCFRVSKSPYPTIELSKATTVNTERTQNTLKKYKSLQEFQPITASSLVNSRVESVFDMKESQIMIDFFNQPPPNALQVSKKWERKWRVSNQ